MLPAPIGPDLLDRGVPELLVAGEDVPVEWYVGSGLSATHLAARILADLVFGHRHRRRAPALDGPAGAPLGTERLRWLSVRSMHLLYREADRREAAGLRRPAG